ncbi:hypothetical protein [Nonomuraea sp. NPDC023979]|uniref:hypothetical protein n=1 Tax=Nonomuraea sp. NPDC023979 TaxID=3154796 RepID=UPI0033FC5543
MTSARRPWHPLATIRHTVIHWRRRLASTALHRRRHRLSRHGEPRTLGAALSASDQLALALGRLLYLYQVRPDDPEDGRLLLTSQPGGEHRYILPLDTTQATHLRNLVSREVANISNTQPGGSNKCAHCGGSGTALPY